MILDSLISALAMAIRCFWPPLKITPFSPTIVSYPSGISIIKSCICAFLHTFVISSSVASGLANFILSFIDKLKIYGACETIDILFLIVSSDKSFIFKSSIKIVPLSIS